MPVVDPPQGDPLTYANHVTAHHNGESFQRPCAILTPRFGIWSWVRHDGSLIIHWLDGRLVRTSDPLLQHRIPG